MDQIVLTRFPAGVRDGRDNLTQELIGQAA
jgi:hypothetical protein